MMEYAKFGIWLDHFGSFEKYIDFFCLNDFVKEIKKDDDKKEYIPWDMTSIIKDGDSYKPTEELKADHVKIKQLMTLCDDCLENMLQWLSNTIRKRSETCAELSTVRIITSRSKITNN